MKLNQARIDALTAIRNLGGESSKDDVLSAFSLSRKVFKVKAFEPVEKAAWDMALAGGCWGVVQRELECFAKSFGET